MPLPALAAALPGIAGGIGGNAKGNKSSDAGSSASNSGYISNDFGGFGFQLGEPPSWLADRDRSKTPEQDLLQTGLIVTGAILALVVVSKTLKG